jgi:hypothetical protein
MAWSELERLVDEAEGDAVLRRGLRRCRSRRELILVACRLGYRINLADLRQAWLLGGGERVPGISSIVKSQ